MATESDNINAGAVGTTLTVLAVFVFGTALALTALVRGESEADTIAKVPESELVAAKKSQTEELNQAAAWVDKAEGQVSVPVSQAMELTTAGLKADPQSATPYPPEKPDAGTDAGADAAGDAGVETADAAGVASDAAAPEAPVPDGVMPEGPAPQPAPPDDAPKAPAPKKAPQPKAPLAPQPPPPGPPPTDDAP